MVVPKVQLTQLLRAWQRGDSGADDELFTQAYGELRRQAARFMLRERRNHTLQPTAIVHEAWLKIQNSPTLYFENSSDFFAVAATIMRHILVEHARKRVAAKRGGGKNLVTLHEDMMSDPKQREIQILALNEALSEFENIDPVRSRIIELRYFAGLSIEMTAKVLGRSVRSVNRDWSAAKAWLSYRLGET